MLRKHLIRFAIVAVAALAILVAGTAKAKADVTYGNYGIGHLQVDCWPDLHYARFSVLVTGSEGLTYRQLVGYKIDVYQAVNGSWTYVNTTDWVVDAVGDDGGISLSGQNLTRTWEGWSQPGYYTYHVFYAWQTPSGFVVGHEWIKNETVWTWSSYYHQNLASHPGYCSV